MFLFIYHIINNLYFIEKHISIDKNVSMTEVTPDEGYSGLSRVEVDVEIPVEDNKQVTITENGTTTLLNAPEIEFVHLITPSSNL